MKHLIKKILKEENLKQNLKQQIRHYGWKDAAELVGGVDNLLLIMDFESPMEFLHIFDGMGTFQSKEEEDWILFRYIKQDNLMIYIKKSGRAHIGYIEIWSFLKDVLKLTHTEIQEITKTWLLESYNLDVVSTHHNLLSGPIGAMRFVI
jgi:hypothetical protein